MKKLPTWNSIEKFQWKLNEKHHGKVTFGKLDVAYTAVSFENDKKIEITSAGFGNEVDSEWKAFGECIERITAFEYYYESSKIKDDVKICITNGLAAFTDEVGAQSRAQKELIERDAILKSWMGIISPPRLIQNTQCLKELDIGNYDLKSYLISEVSYQELIYFVCMTFLIPHLPNLPLVYGFGCDVDMKVSSTASFNEMFQRYIFLKDEVDFESDINFSPSAYYHQDFYLRNKNRKFIFNWINQDYEGLPQIEIKNEFQFETIRKNPLFVVKATNSDCWDLYFGNHSYEKGKYFRSNCELHPIP